MLEYVVKGNYVEIVGATDDETVIEIPKKIDDYIVVKIQDNAFAEHPSLISITIPKTVKVIGSYAFASCKRLKKVILEDGVQYINDWAFISCNIEDIEFPESLIYLGENAFLGSKCYDKAKEWKEVHNTLSQNYINSKHDMCIFPNLSLNENKLTEELVLKLKSYQDTQIAYYKDNKDDLYNLDIPYVFNNKEFIIAVNSLEKLEDITLNIPTSTHMHVGNYSDDDPDFILFELELHSNNELLGSVLFKTPYPDDVNFKIIETEFLNGVNIIKIKPNIESFGSGNIDREFTLDYYDEILMKFKSAYNNKIVSFEEYDEIEKKLIIAGKNKVLQLITEIENAPLLTLILKLFTYVCNDLEYESKIDEIKSYLDNLIVTYYNEIKDIDSLHKISFNVSKHYKFLKEITGLEYNKLCEKYDLTLVDSNGIEINEQRLQELSESFYENEELYNLHGYIYDDIMEELADFIEEYYDNKLIKFLNNN